MLLVGRTLVGVTRRDRNPDAQFFGIVEKCGDVVRSMAIENGRVDVDGETLGLGRLDGGNCAVESAFLRYGLIVMVAQAIEVYREEQIGRGIKQMQLLLQEQRIGAERHEFFLCHESSDDIADLAMNERLPPRDG